MISIGEFPFFFHKFYSNGDKPLSIVSTGYHHSIAIMPFAVVDFVDKSTEHFTEDNRCSNILQQSPTNIGAVIRYDSGQNPTPSSRRAAVSGGQTSGAVAEVAISSEQCDIINSSTWPIRRPHLKLARSASVDQLTEKYKIVGKQLKAADGTELDDMARYPPTTLSTVLENMPLVYNSSTRQLELENSENTLSPRECHRLLNAVKSLKCSNDDVDLGESKCAAAVPSKVPFRKCHARRSSYDSAEIKLYPRGVVPTLAAPSTPQPQSNAHCRFATQLSVDGRKTIAHRFCLFALHILV